MTHEGHPAGTDIPNSKHWILEQLEHAFEHQLLLNDEEEVGPIPILFDNTMCVQILVTDGFLLLKILNYLIYKPQG